MPETMTVTPEIISHELLLTALTPVTHHDASVSDKTNRNLFNRQTVLLPDVQNDAPTISAAAATTISLKHPVPSPLAYMFEDLSFAEYIAILLIRKFADAYNRGEGEGLFSDVSGKSFASRWDFLRPRVSQAANADSLRRFWSKLLSTMQVGSPRNDDVLELLAIPRGTQLDVLHELRTQGHHIVQFARFWHDAHKQMNDAYHEKVGKENSLFASEDDRKWVYLTWNEEQVKTKVGVTRKVDVPHITANSVRHQMLREPAMMQLFSRIGVGVEGLEPGVEALFYNGGNIESGAKAPSNPAQMARMIRERYPSVDLLGGVISGADLGESAVSVFSIIVSKETKHLLPEWAQALPNAEVSAFDMLEDFTFTRQATPGRGGGGDETVELIDGDGQDKKSRGQMIFGFEGLSAGTQFVVQFHLKPYSSLLTYGALLSALEEWQRTPVLGGGAAKGFGKMRIDDRRITIPDTAQQLLDGQAETADSQYLSYLDGNAEALLSGLEDGTLGTGAVLVK